MKFISKNINTPLQKIGTLLPHYNTIPHYELFKFNRLLSWVVEYAPLKHPTTPLLEKAVCRLILRSWVVGSLFLSPYGRESQMFKSGISIAVVGREFLRFDFLKLSEVIW